MANFLMKIINAQAEVDSYLSIADNPDMPAQRVKQRTTVDRILRACYYSAHSYACVDGIHILMRPDFSWDCGLKEINKFSSPGKLIIDEHRSAISIWNLVLDKPIPDQRLVHALESK